MRYFWPTAALLALVLLTASGATRGPDLANVRTVFRAEAPAALLEDGALASINGRGLDLRPGSLLILDFGVNGPGQLFLAGKAATKTACSLYYAESRGFAALGGDVVLENPPATPTFSTRAVSWHDARPRGSFRYAALSCPKPVLLDWAAVLRLKPAYEKSELAGSFESNDDELNGLWLAGWETLRNCTEKTGSSSKGCQARQRNGRWEWKCQPVTPAPVIWDGARRDRHVWTADLFVGARVNYATVYDPPAVLNSLRLLAEQQRQDGFIPASDFKNFSLVLYDYGAFWVLTLYDYFLFTSDLAGIRNLHPALIRQLDALERLRDDRGLLIKKETDLEWAVNLRRAGAVSYLNVLAAAAFERGAKLLAAFGDQAGAESNAKRARRLHEAIRQHLAQKHTLLPDSDADPYHVPLDANGLWLLWGGAPPETAPEIARLLRIRHASPHGLANVDHLYVGLENDAHNRRVWPFATYLALAGLLECGAVFNWQEELQKTWGTMRRGDPGNTYWEWIGVAGIPETPFASLTHVWSAGVTALLSTQVAGVMPVATGAYRVRPQPGTLSWFKSRVPTPKGPIIVDYERRAGGKAARLVIEAPAGLVIEAVELPGSPEQPVVEEISSTVTPNNVPPHFVPAALPCGTTVWRFLPVPATRVSFHWKLSEDLLPPDEANPPRQTVSARPILSFLGLLAVAALVVTWLRLRYWRRTSGF